MRQFWYLSIQSPAMSFASSWRSRLRGDSRSTSSTHAAWRRAANRNLVERRFVSRSAASRSTRMPNGAAGLEQQRLLTAGGVGAHRCLIGHCCCNADPAYHRGIVDAGSYVGFDQIGTLRRLPDEIRADNVARLVRDGFGAQVMMSMDRCCCYLGTFMFPTSAGYLAEVERLKGGRALAIPHLHVYGFSPHAVRPWSQRGGCGLNSRGQSETFFHRRPSITN